MSRLSGNSRRGCGCLSALAGVTCLAAVLVVLFLLSSCSFNKYVIAAGLPNPDSAFQTGTAAGYNVYIWECYQGKRIVLYNVTTELLSRPYEREETACGGTTEFEKKVANERKRELDPKRFW